MFSEEGAAVDCQLIGVWGTWEAWSSCPINPPIPLLNIRRRLRDCIPQPPNCVETIQYNCNGPYSEVVNCVSTTLLPTTSTTPTLPQTTTTTNAALTTTVAITTTSAPTTVTSTTTTTTPIPTTTTVPTTTTTSAQPVTTSTTTTRLLTTTTTPPSTTTTAVPTTVTLTQLITTTVSALFTTTTASVTTTQAGDPACAGTQWNTWYEWSTCTDPCGSCGTHQRLRACTKSASTCKCPGTAIEKTVCITEVCKYPREFPCCDGYSPFSQDGQFLCVLNSTISQQGKR